jgi:hypothetical protein
VKTNLTIHNGVGINQSLIVIDIDNILIDSSQYIPTSHAVYNGLAYYVPSASLGTGFYFNTNTSVWEVSVGSVLNYWRGVGNDLYNTNTGVVNIINNLDVSGAYYSHQSKILDYDVHSESIAIGENSLSKYFIYPSSTINSNIAIGSYTFQDLSINANNKFNIALGQYAGEYIDFSESNLFFGAFTGQGIYSFNYNTINPSHNVLIGDWVANQIKNAGDNVVIGSLAARYLQGDGNTNNYGQRNIIIGSSAVTNVSIGNNNIILGYNAFENVSLVSNKLFIGQNNSALIYGELDTSIIRVPKQFQITDTSHYIDSSGGDDFTYKPKLLFSHSIDVSLINKDPSIYCIETPPPNANSHKVFIPFLVS